MKMILVCLIVFLSTTAASAQSRIEDGAVFVGVNLGELPWGASFKPGLMLGYHLNDLVYVGTTYQFGDSIRRDGTSFNAAGIGRKGVVSSEEDAGGRSLLHTRVRPHRLSPLVSLGLVGNGRDTETTTFDDGLRVTQSRPPGARPSLGLGYSYTFDLGLELSTEWAGWVFSRPAPDISVSGTQLGSEEEAALRRRTSASFQRQITNAYHVFLISAGYAF